MRRSSSICFSPGPAPQARSPPRCRSRWVHPRTRRVDRCCSLASSTCSLPSRLCARCAKMSRISAVRSSTATPRLAFQVALLHPCQRDVQDHHAGAGLHQQLADLLDLAPSQVQRRIRAVAPRQDLAPGRKSPRSRPAWRRLLDRHRPCRSRFGPRRAAQPPPATPTWASRTASARSGIRSGFGLRCQIDRACRHHGRNGVFVDHLGHRVAQQDHVLIKLVDLPLELDSVDQIDRHRDMFLAQRIQERVL